MDPLIFITEPEYKGLFLILYACTIKRSEYGAKNLNEKPFAAMPLRGMDTFSVE